MKRMIVLLTMAVLLLLVACAPEDPTFEQLQNPAIAGGIPDLYCEKVLEGIQDLGESRGEAREAVRFWFLDSARAANATSEDLRSIREAIDFAIESGRC